MMERKKNGSLIVGIIAAVVILAALLALVLTQCVGGSGSEGTTAPEESQEVPTYHLYWNLDREQYAGKSEAGMSSRTPESDGSYHIRFFCNGEEVVLRAKDRQVVNLIDYRDLMGLEFDEEGFIIDAVEPKNTPLELPGYLFFVQSVGGNVIKLNSSDTFDGMELLMETTENTGIWDMTGISGPVGTVSKPVTYDRVICVQDSSGELIQVYLMERSNYFLTHEAQCQHCEETVTWYEWTRETDLPTRSGHYQLMKDVQLSGQQNIKANVKICLDLNGHRVDGAKDSRVISLQQTGSNLALMDTSEEKTGCLAGHGSIGQGGVLWVRSGNFYMYSGTLDGSDVIGTNGAVMMVNSNRYVYLYDGTIIGGTAQAQAMEDTASGFGYGAGGALYVRGTMRMYGGTIRDGRAEAGYNYKKGKLTVNRGYGGNIFLFSGAEFEIQGGQILNGYAGNMGGNIYADGTAELIISGGTISGGRNNSRVKDHHGGNIVAGTKTIVKMSGGTISGGVNPTGAGGNLFLCGKMEMTGGQIYGGRATSGGNIHMSYSATLNQYGGVISGGHAKEYGGNVNVSSQSTFYLRGGTIKGGVADTSGGNINCFSEGTFRMRGGTVSDGIAKGTASGTGGGNIYLRSDKTKVEISGGTISGGKAEGAVAENGAVTGGDGGNINAIRGTVAISGGVITGGEANGNGGGIYMAVNSSSLTLSGNALIYGNGTDIMRGNTDKEGKCQIILDGWNGNGDMGKLVIDRVKGVAGAVLAVPTEGGALTEDTLALFETPRRFLPPALDDENRMILANTLVMGEADHIHCLCGGTYEGHTCTDTGYVSVTAAEFFECFSYHDNAYYVQGNANLCLTEDIVLDAPCFSAGYALNICFNGHTIKAVDLGRLTSNGTTGVMNLSDCTGKGGAVAEGNRTTTLMTTYKGVLNIYGGTYDASAIKLDMDAEASLGAVIQIREEADCFALYGGKLIGGEANRGGAVYANKGSFKMYGGEITGGTARLGGNVFINYGSFEMLGGQIYGGTAESGAGVYMGANAKDGTILLGSDAMIYGNGTEDVYLGSGKTEKNRLIMDGWKGNGEHGALKLNARTAAYGSVVAVAKEGELTGTVTDLLQYTGEKLIPMLREGKVMLFYPADHTHCLCNDSMEHTCEATDFIKVASVEEFNILFDENQYLQADVSVVLDGDLTLDSQYFSNGHIWNLCLNGHTVTMTETARLTANKEGAVLNITDCGEGGKLLAAEGCRESLLTTSGTGVLNLYSGTVDASAVEVAGSSRLGAAVKVGDADDVFTMYGGKLVGGTVDRGGAVYVQAGRFVMHGGHITGGKAQYGGGLFVNRGAFEMHGGTLTGGTADTGAGVYIGANASVKTLLLSGDARIYGNGGEDVYLGSATAADNYLTLDSWNGNGENGALVVNCRGASANSVVAVALEGALTGEDLAKLNYPDAELVLRLRDGKLVLASPHGHCICAGKLSGGQSHTCNVLTYTEIATEEEFEALFNKDNQLSVSSNIVLTGNLELSKSYAMKGTVLNLCLNGHTITMSGAGRLLAATGGELNITDCDVNGKGTIKADEDSTESIIRVNNGTVNLYAGTLDAAALNKGNAASGGTVWMNEVNDAFNMYGGKIVGAAMVKNGGAIYVNKSGIVSMHGGIITGGNAVNGGAVYVTRGSMVMTGGTITDSNATTNGGAVYLSENAAGFTISGTAKIYGNTCGSEPQDVYMGKKDLCLTLDSWNGNGDNGALVLNCGEAADGSVVAQAKEGALTGEDLAKLHYSDPAFTLEVKDGKLVLHKGHVHCLCVNTLQTGCDHGELIFTEIATAEAFLEAILAEGTEPVNLVLTDSFEITGSRYIKGKTVNLCLNGQTLTMNGAKLIEQDGAVLNITTCNGGEIKAGTKTSRQMLYAYTGGGVVNLYAGTINASIIEDSTGLGAAVQIKSDSTQEPGSAFNMYGGHIIGAKSIKRGTVYVESGRFNMYGGKITDGHAKEYGGAVCIKAGHAQIAGGEITGCTAGISGAAIAMMVDADSLTISGNAQIHGNTCADKAEDVYLGNKNKSAFYVILDNWAGNENGEKLHITAHKDKVDGSIIAKAKTGSLTDAACAMLASYDVAYTLKLENGNVVYHQHNHCICNDTLDTGCDHEAVVFTEVSDAESFLAAILAEGSDTVNLALTDSFALTEAHYIDGKTVNLCLNGQIITMNNAKLIATNGGVLNVTTCNGGEIKAGTKTSRQMLYAHTGGGIVNLYGGTINASAIESTDVGAAVQVKNDSTQEPISTFNMYGGHIIGAKSIKRGTVYVESGRFNMYGGKITDGHSSDYGGAVCINTGHVQIAGGEITGCTAAKGGAAIAMLNNADSLTISGNAQIHGNTCADKAEDVYLGNKGKSAFYVILDNWAGNENGEKLHISTHKDKVDGGVIAKAKTGSLTDAACAMLASYDKNYMLKLENGQVVYHRLHEHCLCNGTLKEQSGHTCKALRFTEVATAEAFKALFDSNNKLKADCNMVLTADITLDAVYESGGHSWNLCLNGNSITLEDGAYLSKDCNVMNCALSGAVTEKVDLVMFMGQSNMAGRGVASESEVVPEGHGYEFRAISDPTKLYPIAEPFGVKENNSASGVTENSKTGSMVSAFVKNYYEQSQRTIVAVSCSKGSTGLDFWKVDGNALNDAIARHEAASNWLHANGYTVENDFMVWCQGETDGGDGMSAEDYATGLKGIIEEMIAETGIEFCAVVRIGNAKNDPARHSQIIKAQTQLCKTYDKAVLVSAKLAGYGADMMKDDYHYTQAVYNTVGMDAGINTASYIRTGIEPPMYDPQYDNQYPRDEIPEQPSVNTLEFTFDSATENGIDLSSIGTVANGALTVTEASNKAKNGVNLGDKQFTISPDKSFTIEFVTSGSERVVVLGSGSSKGGFVFFSPVDSPKLRLRFASSSKQFDATTQAVSATAKTHIAIVYDADAKTLSMYQDGVKLTVSGNMSNFGTITFTTLCGGYGNTTDNYYYRGELHYLRFTEQVLTTEQFHKEP